jgi:hypothetical protein
MKVNELRIGNLVTEPSCGNVISISAHGILEIENSKGVVLPILLTEEWLIKFQFENWGRVEVNEYEYYYRWVLNNVIDGSSNYEVHIIHSNYGNQKHVEILYSIDNDERQTVFNTEYVHTLQNAFYLASGFELTIE